MVRKFLVVLTVTIACFTPSVARAQDVKVVVKQVAGVMTLYSLPHAPKANPSHTYVLTHGLCGIDDRFCDAGNALLARDPKASVLVLDWSVNANKRVAKVPNVIIAADCIDTTGNAVGITLARLAKQGRFDPAKATFIGESFGNWVNNRAAIILRKEGLGKVERAIVLNPASEFSGYAPPPLKVNFNQSVACVSDSCLDTRDTIAHRVIALRPTGNGPIERHTAGMEWLLKAVRSGDDLK
jgi:hypothetical protein